MGIPVCKGGMAGVFKYFFEIQDGFESPSSNLPTNRSCHTDLVLVALKSKKDLAQGGLGLIPGTRVLF